MKKHQKESNIVSRKKPEACIGKASGFLIVQNSCDFQKEYRKKKNSPSKSYPSMINRLLSLLRQENFGR